jgi:hypothetical protein
VARPPNYGFEKRRKELAAKAKKEARREERRLRKAQGGAEGEPTADGDTSAAVDEAGDSMTGPASPPVSSD